LLLIIWDYDIKIYAIIIKLIDKYTTSMKIIDEYLIILYITYLKIFQHTPVQERVFTVAILVIWR